MIVKMLLADAAIGDEQALPPKSQPDALGDAGERRGKRRPDGTVEDPERAQALPAQQRDEPDQIDATRDTAAAILSAPSSPATRASRRRLSAKQRLMRDNKAVPAGLILIATLLGWAAVRRRHQARRMEA